jgi:hypothetical protein
VQNEDLPPSNEPYSRFRHLTIPDLQNTLQSASYQHSKGNFEAARQMLQACQTKLETALRQLDEDEANYRSESEESA